ncbi:hypothetical protein Patl1_17383 [Pistacia atlantica]|uniref:Uncharacterized protein n=1 Tax=Pistacia atlantica TaxID=434234 RepID=A0ACC1BYC9_9ROSI|nr:hypothetical protein Patl1_17383 [Pistacia atlantica]
MSKSKVSSTPVLVMLYLVFVLNGLILVTAKVDDKSNVHIVYLGERQHDDPKLITDAHHDMLATVVGSKEVASELMVYSYKHGFSGFAAKLTEAQARQLAELPGVIRVVPNSLHRLQTTRSWDYLGLSSHSPSNVLHNSNMGNGVIIGVLDTGIWPESKAFSDEGLEPIPSRWKGLCQSGDQFNASTHCNRKIIGARWFVNGFLAEYGKPLNTSGDQEFFSPRDANGHGTHTSSTAAGSFVHNVSYKGLGFGNVRGGAPRARLAIYKVCWNVLGGQCASADILKAFDEAIHDRVDVLSLSIGSAIPLFSDVDERDGIATGSFHAVARGITVVCGAANEGPSAQTVQNTAPWILTVAASTMDRAFPSTITLGNNRTLVGQAVFTGKESGFTGLVYPEAAGLDPNSAGVCQDLSLNATKVAGKVVICFASGKPLLAKVAFFSSRGPNSIAPAILKPDITAPGVNILAATSPLHRLADNGYVLFSGTSMATPHVSGIVALVKALHPDWSPAAIKSALITTARRNGPSGFPIFAEGSPQKLANPFDFGGGIVNPNEAADPGLIYDMNTADYIHYLCAMEYNNTDISRLTGQPTMCPDPKPSMLDINLPSITIPSLRNSVTITRTVTNVGNSKSVYRAAIEHLFGTMISVQPNVLVFNATNQKISFRVTISTTHELIAVNLFLILNVHNSLIAPVSATSKVHIVYLGEKQHDDPELITKSHHEMLESIVGSKEAAADLMVYSYKHGFSGFAAKLTESQAQKLAELHGVVRITPNQFHSLQTTRSWDYLDLSSYSPNNLLHDTNMGDGIIIGLLDTGVWPESEIFNDEGLGPIPTRWKGHCQSGQLFNGTTDFRIICPLEMLLDMALTHQLLLPGSFVANTSYKGIALGTVRGGAPRARIAMYKVCWNVPAGQCSSADILKAFDEAIHDGVDLFSLSLGTQIPLFPEVDERDGISVGSFHAVARGIPVICAAANDGPAAQTVHNTAPWILTIAATTIDRSFPTPITLGNNITVLGQALFAGREIDFTGLVYPEVPGLRPTVPGVCESLSLNNTSVVGKVVLCFTTVARRSAMTNAVTAVRAAGGVGVIIARNPSHLFGPCSDDFPCIVVDYELGTQILFYIRSTSSPTVKLSTSRTLVGKPVATKVAYFSSRGPSSISPAILKPDIAAPGVSILAASAPLDPFMDAGFAVHSGTSIAAPIVSGIVALLKAENPDWSPAAIRSAIVTTAWKTDPFGEPIFTEGSPRKLADPFDYGGGLVNPSKASEPGLIYDMGTADYIHYLCAVGYNESSISQLVGQATMCPSTKPSILDVNLPSITIPNVKESVTLIRSVTNVGPSHSIYKSLIEHPFGIAVAVKPDILVFNSSTKMNSFKVTVSTTHKVNTGYYFGSLTWTDGVHNVTIPISVRTQIIEFYTDDN